MSKTMHNIEMSQTRIVGTPNSISEAGQKYVSSSCGDAVAIRNRGTIGAGHALVDHEDKQTVPTPPEASAEETNIYLRMPLAQVRADALNGVIAARQGWRLRDPEGAARVLGRVVEPGRERERIGARVACWLLRTASRLRRNYGRHASQIKEPWRPATRRSLRMEESGETKALHILAEKQEICVSLRTDPRDQRQWCKSAEDRTGDPMPGDETARGGESHGYQRTIAVGLGPAWHGAACADRRGGCIPDGFVAGLAETAGRDGARRCRTKI